MAMGGVDETSGGGKWDLSTPERAYRFYQTAVEERERHRALTLTSPNEWRNVAYWTGITDMYESLMMCKIKEFVIDNNS